MEVVAARLLARPILHEYDASTVDELAANPASVQSVEAAAASLHNGNKRRETACRREPE